MPYDTTLRPICFKINALVTPEIASTVGPEKFKRYEHALYIMAQLSKLAYCDSGIAHKILRSSFGLSNDIVTKIINVYNVYYLKERKMPIYSQKSFLKKLPMESFALGPAGSGRKYGTYISSPDDVTCYILTIHDLKHIQENPNSIFLPSDVAITFKGTNTYINLKDDFLSQFAQVDIQEVIKSTGIKLQEREETV